MSKKLASLIIKINANGAQAEKELKTLEKKVNDFGKSMQNFGKNMSKYVTVPLTALAAASVKLADTQLQAEAKLLNALKGREDVQKRLMAQASEMQSRSLFGDEAIIEQQAFLAALGLSEQQISDTIEAAMQLSAALGMDLTSATKNLAKTYGGLTGELGESIPALKTLTAEELKAGEAIKFVNDNYKGFAETAAKTGAGSLVQLKNKLGDLAEKLGMILLPILNDIVAVVGKIADYLSSLPEGAQKTIVVIGPIAAAIGPLAMGLGSLLSTIQLLSTTAPAAGKSIASAFGKGGPAFLALSAIIAMIVEFNAAMGRAEQWSKEWKDKEAADFKSNSDSAYNAAMNRYLGKASPNLPAAVQQAMTRDKGDVKVIEKMVADAKMHVDAIKHYLGDMSKLTQVERDFLNSLGYRGNYAANYKAELPYYEAQLDGLRRALTDINSGNTMGKVADNLQDITTKATETTEAVTEVEKAIVKVDKIATKGVKFGVSAPKGSPLETSFDIEAWKRKFLPMADEMVAMIDSLNSAVSSAFGNLASAMGEGIEAAITGDEFKPMQRLMLIIGDMLKQMGAALVAYATALEAFKEAFKNPWVALGAGLAAIAAGATITGLAKKGIPKLATGGLAYTPTLAVVGDNAGAANDPEVIAPLSKLRSYMGGTKLELVGDIKWELRGDTLRAVLNRDNVRLKTLG